MILLFYTIYLADLGEVLREEAVRPGLRDVDGPALVADVAGLDQHALERV